MNLLDTLTSGPMGASINPCAPRTLVSSKCDSFLFNCSLSVFCMIMFRDGSIPKFQPIPMHEFLCQPIMIPMLEFPKKNVQLDLSGTFTSNVHKLHKLLNELSAEKTSKQHFSLILPFFTPVYLQLKQLNLYKKIMYLVVFISINQTYLIY